MPATPQNHSDNYQETLAQLLADILHLRNEITEDAQQRLTKYQPYYHSGVFSKSAVNLAHYLALRQFDLRHL